METATALAGQIEPTAIAALTQAAAIAETAQAAVGTITPPAPVGQADAATVITTYACTVPGINVSITCAGGMTGDVTRSLSLPPAATGAPAQAEGVAYETYGALLSNGAASVSYGSGTITGDVTVDVQAASLGAFSLDMEGNPGSEADALALARAAFPGIADRAYVAYAVPKGWA